MIFMDFKQTGSWNQDSNQSLTAASLAQVQGFTPLMKKKNALHTIKLRECADVWAGFLDGDISRHLMMQAMNPTEDYVYQKLHSLAPHIFNEAMTSGDFSNLTTYVMDRTMLDNFDTFPSVYDKICRVHDNVRDFRTVERWKTDGGETEWQPVAELEPFNRTKESTSKYSYKVGKYEGGAQVSWEAIINDDMDQFGDLAMRIATGGWRTIELFFTRLVADANGPHASFYTSGNGNIINTANFYSGGTANPALSAQSLYGALGQFMNLMTAENRPINAATDVVNVMVGDGFMYNTLMSIINTQMLATTIIGGSKASSAVMYDTQLQVRNWIAGRINPIYNPELRNVVTASSGAVAAKSWWIFTNGTGGKQRTAVELGFLSGYRKPVMFRKLPNTIRVSGGSADEMGSFELMATEFKGLTVVGGTRMEPKLTLASNGSGS